LKKPALNSFWKIEWGTYVAFGQTQKGEKDVKKVKLPPGLPPHREGDSSILPTTLDTKPIKRPANIYGCSEL